MPRGMAERQEKEVEAVITKTFENRRSHARSRANERYGVWLSYEELDTLAEKVRKADAVLLKRATSTKTIWLVEWKERVYKVCYTTATHQLTSFLPLPGANNDILLQMYHKLRKEKGEKQKG